MGAGTRPRWKVLEDNGRELEKAVLRVRIGFAVRRFKHIPVLSLAGAFILLC
jgi:hypothetical protein